MMQLDNSGPIVDQGDHDLYRPSGLLEIGKAASQCQVGVLQQKWTRSVLMLEPLSSYDAALSTCDAAS